MHMKQKGRQGQMPKRALGLFLFLGIFVSLTVGKSSLLLANSTDLVKTVEEMTADEKKAEADILLEAGDRYREMKQYHLAMASYEHVFVLDRANTMASKKIDELKSQMLNEGLSETETVAGVYDEEIKARIRVYWKRIQEYLAHHQWGRARFTLEKLLLLDPPDPEATSLHRRLKQAASEGKEPEELVLPHRLRSKSSRQNFEEEFVR